jgi:hypothetical protein
MGYSLVVCGQKEVSVVAACHNRMRLLHPVLHRLQPYELAESFPARGFAAPNVVGFMMLVSYSRCATRIDCSVLTAV